MWWTPYVTLHQLVCLEGCVVDTVRYVTQMVCLEGCVVDTVRYVTRIGVS